MGNSHIEQHGSYLVKIRQTMKLFSCFCAALLLFPLLLNAAPSHAQQPVIRVGDYIELQIFVPNTNINSALVVDANGMLDIVFIGKVKVADLNCWEAQRLIAKRFRETLEFTYPAVTATITISAQPFIKISGEVWNPGQVAYSPGLTLMTAIASVGGFTDFSHKRTIKFVRNGKVTIIDAHKISRDPSLDIKLQPGDQIFIPGPGSHGDI